MTKYLLLCFLVLTVAIPKGLCQEQQSSAHPSRETSQSSLPKLTNKEIISMVKASLSQDIVIAKIQSSACDFDTSAETLVALKAAGVPDAVILAMVKRDNSVLTTHEDTTKPPAAPAPPADSSGSRAVTSVKELEISYSTSAQKSFTGSYDDYSKGIVALLGDALTVNSLKRVDHLDGDCCRVALHLLRVKNTAKGLGFGNQRIDLEAYVTVTNANTETLYSGSYKGHGSRWFGWDPNGAEKDLVGNIVGDGNLIRALTTGTR